MTDVAGGRPDALERARGLLRDGDPAGAVRGLRWAVDDLVPADWAAVLADAAQQLGLADLAAHAAVVAGTPSAQAPTVQALYDLGYDCVEYGLSYLAVPALTEALQLAPGERALVRELVAALRAEYRYTEAVGVLEERADLAEPWPDHYLLVLSALFAGDVDRTDRYAAQLPAPTDPSWSAAHTRLRGALDRLAALRDRSPLDRRDLRGWHYVLNGTVLTLLSPYGFDDGMNGRYAYLQDEPARCREGLEQARAALAAAGRLPGRVGLLPDRSSTALGLAAAALFDLPALPYEWGLPDALVIAYDLGGVADDVQRALVRRPDGQILLEHACRWTTPPAVAADVGTLLVQRVVAPWEEHLRAGPEGARQVPADPRPPEALAAEIVSAAVVPPPDEPPDRPGALADLAVAIGPAWPARGTRATPVWSPGPVSSSMFL